MISDEQLEELKQEVLSDYELNGPEDSFTGKLTDTGEALLLLIAEEQSRRAVPSEEVQRAIKAIKDNYPPSNYTMLREGLDLAITALRQMQGWIPCSERLPEEIVQCLVFIPSFIYESCNYQGGAEFGFYVGNEWRVPSCFPVGKVTHWMPLPEPPKTTKDPLMHIQV